MSLDLADIVGRMLVPAAVVVVLGLLRRYLPAPKTNPQAQLDQNGDVEDFTSTNVAVNACMIVIGIAFAFTSHWALAAGNRHFAQADGPATFQFFPSGAICWFFPGFGALCLSWEITLFLWSLLQGSQQSPPLYCLEQRACRLRLHSCTPVDGRNYRHTDWNSEPSRGSDAFLAA
jgi:hypothetical protein